LGDDTVGTPDQQSESGTTDSAIDHKQSPTVHELRDVDAYREFLSGWVLQAVPLDHDGFGVRWVTRDLPDVMLNRYTTAGALREVYVKEPGVTAFVLLLPAAGGGDFRVQGRRFDPMTLALLQPDTEYEIISPAGGHTLEAYVPDELLASLGLDRWLEPTANVRPDSARAQAFAELLSPMVTPGLGRASPPELDQRTVLEALSMALDSVDRSAPPVAQVPLHATYRRAISAIESEPDPMLTVVELAARLGVTTRTLRYAFRYALGISPYQFMLRRRMTIVREALLDPSRPERTVLELLLAHGISHQGEFASQYRRLFGETPSQTRACLPKRWPAAKPDAGWPRTPRAAR
jgi:AraC family ethanolamine operon transcriptional activator